MKHLFCSYELSLLAKEKGFDEGCLGLYYKDNIFSLTKCESHNQYYGQECSTPLYSQLVDWFFYKGYYLHTYFISEANKFGCDVYDLKDQLKFSPFLDKKPLCVTKQEAIEQALFETFKLI